MLIRRGEGKRGGDKRGLKKANGTTAADFAKVATMLKNKNVIFGNLMDMTGDSYLEAIYIMQLFDSETKGKAFEPKKARNRNTDKIATYYRFSTTELDLTADTFKQAIERKNYVKDECFINCLYDFYKDSLLSADKKRNVITRASILETIGKTEDNVKEGISIEDILPFFEKHRLQLRVFDRFYKLFFKYDPPNRNHHNKAMYCMQADGHIYTLNFERSKLEQIKESENDLEIKLHVGTDYAVREDGKPMEAKMIYNVADILRILKEESSVPTVLGKKVVKLIHRDDDLMTLMHELVENGYHPGINFEAGRITALKLEFNGVFFIIETQQLVKSAIDGNVVVDDEGTYNNMNRAMFELGSKLFSKSHKSYYTDEDLNILDRYRTKPICGTLEESRPSKGLIEIDISKAYTSAFSSITEIPVFNEFDAFKPYDGHEPLDLNLYLVEGDKHDLATQSVNLVYGKFYGKKWGKIVAYKQPSFIKQVDYKKLVDELYSTRISEDDDHDVYIKKLIANVNIGLLEKSFNRKSAGYLFQDLDEAKYYQAQYGGNVHMLQKIEHVKTICEASPLGLDDGIQNLTPIESVKFRCAGIPFYVLVLQAQAQLKNGFRYIKELVLQTHNSRMRKAYHLLKQEGIQVYSVKTDCFTIKAEDKNLAEYLLDFGAVPVCPTNGGMGCWRVSKTSDIIPLPLTSFPLIASGTLTGYVSSSKSIAVSWSELSSPAVGSPTLAKPWSRRVIKCSSSVQPTSWCKTTAKTEPP